MTLETQRLLLRPWREDDAEALYKYASDPEVGPRAGWPPHKSVEESREIIKGIFRGEGMWAIELKETHEPIGCAGYLPASCSNLSIAEDECEVGYWVARPYWGQGICTEAMRAIIDYCFNDKGFTTLWGDYFPSNPASGKVMEKCGFVDTGRETICPNLELGGDQPVRIMCLTKEEYMKEKMIAPCGLDCAKCDARIATLNNDDALRAKTAELWNKLNNFDAIKPEHINCLGCLVDGSKTLFCATLCEVRKCCTSKGYSSCAECSQKTSCPHLKPFVSNPEAKANLGL